MVDAGIVDQRGLFLILGLRLRCRIFPFCNLRILLLESCYGKKVLEVGFFVDKLLLTDDKS